MRDTAYATELASVAIGDNRIERLFVKDENQEEIRFSWWPNGNMANRPLDLPEEQLIALLARGIQGGVLSSLFLPRLIVAAASSQRD
jgi:hypothetical protein